MRSMDDDLIAVESILLQAQDAPKYGFNSRELVLRAARAAVHGPAAAHTRALSSTGQPCNSAAPPDNQQGQQACSGEVAEQLVQSLTVHERPLVQYIARCAVPRIARQVSVDQSGIPTHNTVHKRIESEPKKLSQNCSPLLGHMQEPACRA